MIDFILVMLFVLTSLLGAVNRRAGYLSLLSVSLAFLIYSILSISILGYFSVIAAVVWVLVSLFSLSYGKNYGRWLPSLISLMIAGMALILVSDNYLYVIAGWEIMSVPSYVIVGLNRKDHGPPFVFMLFSEISTVFLVLGAAYAYTITGTLYFTGNSSYVPMLLISIGSLIKMGMSPFMISEWLPIAHGNAPANASAVLSATMTLMGVYLITRMMLLSPHNVYVGILFLTISAISIIFASMYAYVSENMKMLAGFSTIENNAAILAAAGLYLLVSSQILATFILYTIVIMSFAHSIGKGGLFMSIGNTEGEHFSQISGNSDAWNDAGTFLSTMSLSGLFPTIGGLGVWMLLEAFFMEAYFGGFPGVVAIVVGSIVALGEGMATGSMVKYLSFSSLFHRKRDRVKEAGTTAVFATGILLVVMFSISIFVISQSYLGGIPGVLVYDGFMITSRFGPADFGLVSPDYILLLIAVFSLAGYAVFGKPRTRKVPVWNGGRPLDERFTSYAYSNNIKLMLKRTLMTRITDSGEQVTVMDFFWSVMKGIGVGYRRMSKTITIRFMNSSIGWYMIYMLAAFLGTLIIFAFMNGYV